MTPMTLEQRQKFEDEQRLNDMSIDELEDAKRRWVHGSEHRAIVESILAKRLEERRKRFEEERVAADAPTQKRFEQTFQQTERHHRASKRWALAGAAISLFGAAASWTGVWFSHSQAQRVQQFAATPAPTAVATPASVATPAPTAVATPASVAASD
jgi:hypothetical protein